MNTENKSGEWELDLDQLRDISGGTGFAKPTATGAVSYHCPACGRIINASDHDTTVICPYVDCRTSYRVEAKKLVALPSTPLKSVL